jgi:hypothetical protein
LADELPLKVGDTWQESGPDGDRVFTWHLAIAMRPRLWMFTSVGRLGHDHDGNGGMEGRITSMTLAHEFERIVGGGNKGRVTHRIDVGDRAAIACRLGGPENRTLFMLTSTDAYPKRLVGTQLSRVDTVIVDTPGAGLP